MNRLKHPAPPTASHIIWATEARSAVTAVEAPSAAPQSAPSSRARGFLFQSSQADRTDRICYVGAGGVSMPTPQTLVGSGNSRTLQDNDT